MRRFIDTKSHKLIRGELVKPVVKAFLLIVMALFSLKAYSYSVPMNCSFVNQSYATCTLYNNSVRPIYCTANARGRTWRGFWVNASGHGVVYPGQFMNVYVRAHNPYYDPIVSARAVAHCRYY